jgi:hypothetical protein
MILYHKGAPCLLLAGAGKARRKRGFLMKEGKRQKLEGRKGIADFRMTNADFNGGLQREKCKILNAKLYITRLSTLRQFL